MMPNVNDYKWTDPATGLPTTPGVGNPTPINPVVPTTPTATTTTPTTTPTTTIPSNTLGYINYETPEERAFRESWENQQRLDATNPIDENAIRTKTLAQFQAEIDALNRVYAEKKRIEQIAGQGRMGSVAAVGARRGLIGSDFGIAQERNQEVLNAEVLNAIESERLAKEASILSEARKMASDEIEKRTEAKRLGSENYLKYISESSARREKNAKEIAKRIYDSGIENPDFASLAKEIGVSVDALKKTYEQYKQTADQEKADAEQKAAEEAVKLEQEKAEKAEQESLKRQQELLKEGYIYIKTPAERDALKNKGYEIIEIAGRTYGKKPVLKTTTVKSGSTNYLITTDEMGNIVKRQVIGSGAGTGVPAPKFDEKGSVSKIKQFFYGRTGDDGKVSPDDYNAAKSAWIEDGGTAKSFDANFYKMKNPNNVYYQ